MVTRPWQIRFSVYVHVCVFYIISLLMYFHIKIVVQVQQKNVLLAFLVSISFWQLSWLYDFTINAVANLFVHERLKIPEVYSEPSQTSKIELFAKIINGSKSSKTISHKKLSKLFDWVLNMAQPASQEFFTYFQGNKFCRKKIGRIKEWFFAHIWWNYWENYCINQKEIFL